MTELQLEGNRFTRIPDQMSQVDSTIRSMNLGYNEINSVSVGSIHFKQHLDLSWNQLIHLEDGVFQGDYTNSTTNNLSYNYLTRFDSGVFESVLLQMEPYHPNSFVNDYNNPFDCVSDFCHLASLIRDNPDLLKAVTGGRCTNGTRFERLDPNGFNHCPSACPPAKDLLPCTCGVRDDFTLYLDCTINQPSLEDTRIGEILDVFLYSSSSVTSPLDGVYIENKRQVTRIPSQLSNAKFNRLSAVYTRFNEIRSIQSGAFHFQHKLQNLIFLDSNPLDGIEPDAFQGSYCLGSIISLFGSNLTRFESKVFQSVLKQMAPYGYQQNTYVYLAGITIDCQRDPCHLGWLLRDNRHLLNSVLGAYCSNGLTFDQIDSSVFNDCPDDQQINTDDNVERCNITTQSSSPTSAESSAKETTLNSLLVKLLVIIYFTLIK